MSARRIVTGHDARGRSVFVDDAAVDVVEAVMPPNLQPHRISRLWAVDERPTFPDAGAPPDVDGMFPPGDGFRAMLVVVPPAPDATATSGATGGAEAERAADAALPGVARFREADNPGMHTTDTVDVVLIVDGEIHLELDDGAERRVGTGDVVIQNGTRHRWNNRSARPVTMLAVLIGAQRQDRPPQADDAQED